jgi:hypothetical protein
MRAVVRRNLGGHLVLGAAVCVLFALSGRAAFHAAARNSPHRESSRRVMGQLPDASSEPLAGGEKPRLQPIFAVRVEPYANAFCWRARRRALPGLQYSFGYVSARKLLIALQRLSLSDPSPARVQARLFSISEIFRSRRANSMELQKPVEFGRRAGVFHWRTGSWNRERRAEPMNHRVR